MTVQEPKLEKKEKELDFLRFKSQFRLKLAWDNIIEKYSKDFEKETDEIDLETEKIVIDRGALRKSDPKVFGTVDSNPISPSKAKEAWSSSSVRGLFEEKGLIEYYDDGSFDLDQDIARKQNEIEHDGYSSGSDIEDLQSPTRQPRYIFPRYLHRPRIVRYPSVVNIHRPLYGQMMYKRRIARMQNAEYSNHESDEEHTSGSASEDSQSDAYRKQKEQDSRSDSNDESTEDSHDEEEDGNSEHDQKREYSPEHIDEKDDLIEYPSDKDKSEVLQEIDTPRKSKQNRKFTSYSENDKENWDPNQLMETKSKRDHEESDWLARSRYPTSIYHTPKRIRVMPVPTFSAIRYASPRMHSYPTYSVPRYPIRYQIPVKLAVEQPRYEPKVSHSKESDEDELLNC